MTGVTLRLPSHILIVCKERILLTDTNQHQIKSNPQICSFLQFHHRDCNPYRSIPQSFCPPNWPHRIEYWRYQCNGSQMVTQGPPRKIGLASETQVKTIPRDTSLTSTTEHRKGQRHHLCDIISLPLSSILFLVSKLRTS